MSTPAPSATPRHRPSLRERLRREAYLLDLQVWLDTYPGRRRRALVRQLRADLDAAAVESSMSEAIASLGDARSFAREYLDLLPRDRPRWQVGAAWALGWLAAWLLVVSVFVAALLQVAAGAGPDGVRARLLWAELTVRNTGAGVSVESLAGFPWSLVIALTLFLFVGRAWRVVPALRPGRRDGA
ncbi:hypothetical protein FE374_15510 [Georgenia yuyongxinii]|uniref:Uncharacterized protein n=1 Tax=Georgenia yuyongxinii TaxID=2589797 RepID=A0A5B8C5L8_9MICO|nr:hypothetical protein [Georgenia yuyongxinii]QDC25833.1 hypothetical protein FE374_15510 [Georgenia yuyongxinii]